MVKGLLVEGNVSVMFPPETKGRRFGHYGRCPKASSVGTLGLFRGFLWRRKGKRFGHYMYGLPSLWQLSLSPLSETFVN